MTLLGWLLLGLGIVASWFFWTLLHELSHVIVARAFRKLTKVEYKLYPHKDEDGHFYFAQVQFWWSDGGPLTNTEVALMKLAPRVLDIIALIAFPFIGSFGIPMSIIWGVLWGAGLIDFFVGSLGISPLSDMRIAAQKLGINPNVIRVLSLTAILVSSVWGVLSLLA